MNAMYKILVKMSDKALANVIENLVGGTLTCALSYRTIHDNLHLTCHIRVRVRG